MHLEIETQCPFNLQELTNVINEQYGLPLWLTYGLFAIGTVLLGALLGLCFVCVVDVIFPAKGMHRKSFTAIRDDDDKNDANKDDIEDDLDETTVSDEDNPSETDTKNVDDEKEASDSDSKKPKSNAHTYIIIIC